MKFIELHADFLSGFYMGGKDSAIDLKPYTDAFFNIGDYGFTEPDHHGTPEEKVFHSQGRLQFAIGQTHRLSRGGSP